MGCVVGNALILSNIGFCQSLLELVLDKNTMLMTEADSYGCVQVC